MGGFADKIRAHGKAVGVANKDVMTNVALKLWGAIMDDSPVDTGRFRANWQVTQYKPATGTTRRTRSPAAKGEADIRSMTSGTWYFTNNLPYAQVIEFGEYPDGDKTTGGFSDQAKKGVLRVHFARFTRLLEAEAAKRKV